MSLRVDVASGITRLHAVDLRLPGYIPLVLSRTYRSDPTEDSLYGVGWSSNLDIRLRVEGDRIVFNGPSGRATYFKPIEEGLQVQHPESRLILQHHADVYVVVVSPRRQFVFSKQRTARDGYPIDRVEDASGNHIQFAYRGALLATLADTVGRRIDFDYAGKRVTAIYVSGADERKKRRVRAFRYDRHGDLVAVQDAAGRKTSYEYDDHLMVTRTNRLGGTQYAQYDDEGRCLTLWHGDGALHRGVSYDDHRQTRRVIDALGRQSFYLTLNKDLVMMRSGPLADEAFYHYDEAHRLIGFTSDDGDLITHQHLEDQVLTQVDGERRLAAIGYNAMELAETVIDPFENEYHFSYDDAHHVTHVTTPRGHTWGFERDRRGWVSRIQSPEGRWVQRELRSDGLTVEDEEGLRYTAQVDVFGREFEREDALGRKIQRTYDPEGRLTRVAVGKDYTAEFTYTAEGQLTGLVDSEDRQTKRQYDAFGRLRQYIGPDEQRWTFQYDREGCLIGAADAKQRTLELSYDERGWLTQLIAPDGTASDYRYDGEHIVIENDTGRYRHTYTPLGELEEIAGPDGLAETVTYGPYGDLRLLETEDEPLLADYDEDGRLAAIERGEESVVFAYDHDGHLVGVEGEAGTHIDLHRDARGRLVTAQGASEVSIELTYDAADRLTTVSRDSQEQIEFSYDALDRLRESVVKHAGGETERIVFSQGDAPRKTLLGAGVGQDASSISQAVPTNRKLIVCQSPHRIVLFLRTDGLQIPMLVQDDLLRREVASLQEHILQACVEGPDRLFDEGRSIYDLDVLRRWSTGTAVGLDLAAIPGHHAVGGMPLLRSFFLRQPFLDPRSARVLREELPPSCSDRREGFDPLITGTHREGPLNPLVWPERHIAPRLRRTTVLFGRGDVTADDVLRLFALPGNHPLI